MKQSPDTHSSSISVSTPRRRRALVWSVPLILFLGLAVMLGLGLHQDPSRLPSPLIGKQVPSFTLSALDNRPPGLACDDLFGEVSLVNVFASWCVACLQEHPLFMKLLDVVPIHGINYKDAPSDALALGCIQYLEHHAGH